MTAIRFLFTDASGTNIETCLHLTRTIRGVAESTIWNYTTLTRPDGSIYGSGHGVMTTQRGDVIHLIGHGSGQAAQPGGTTKFRTMLHPHSTWPKHADLNSIGLAGEYDVAPNGSAVNKCWQWK